MEKFTNNKFRYRLNEEFVFPEDELDDVIDDSINESIDYGKIHPMHKKSIEQAVLQAFEIHAEATENDLDCA